MTCPSGAFPQIFPLQLVWISSIILFCGGGLNSASAFMWAMASESIPSARRQFTLLLPLCLKLLIGSRSHAFYYIFSAFYVAELLASFIASTTMDISPWIPSGLAMASIVLCLLVLWLAPHPDRLRNTGNQNHDFEEAPDLRGHSLAEDFNTRQSTETVDGLIAALSNPNLLLVIPVFLVGIFRYTTLNVLIQYASVRFSLKISTGATFYTETAIVNIVLFLVLIPRFTAYLRKEYEVRPEAMDLVLVRTSVLFMCVGSFAIGLAPSSKLLPLGIPNS
jgi:hypothetical protein